MIDGHHCPDDIRLARLEGLGLAQTTGAASITSQRPALDWRPAWGDAILRRFARRLEATVRTGDFVARTGGDEFLVLCDGPLDGAAAIAAASSADRGGASR